MEEEGNDNRYEKEYECVCTNLECGISRRTGDTLKLHTVSYFGSCGVAVVHDPNRDFMDLPLMEKVKRDTDIISLNTCRCFLCCTTKKDGKICILSPLCCLGGPAEREGVRDGDCFCVLCPCAWQWDGKIYVLVPCHCPPRIKML